MKKVLGDYAWHWWPVTLCLALTLATWLHRTTLYHILSAYLPAVYIDLGVTALFAVSVVCAWAEAHCPSRYKTRAQKAFRKAGLHNALGEYPTLVSVRPDPHKAYGQRWIVRNNGLAPPDFDRAVERLQAGLNGILYDISYGRSTSFTEFGLLPWKYARATILDMESHYLCQEPNLLCVGKTGSGKSYFLALLLGLYARYIPGVCITICDYKKSSFAEFEGTPNFYGYEAVPDGIRAFYQEFTERLAANDEARNQQVRVLLIDEYGALISAQDKKAADELKTMVANMLFMGRSLGMRVIIGVQRADSEHFKAGARDQFRAILALGNLSKEQKSMLFTDWKDGMTRICGLGEGYLFMDGRGAPEWVKVAPIRDMDALNASILEAINR